MAVNDNRAEGLPRSTACHVRARIVTVEEENYRTRTFTTDLHWPHARPGQFAMVWLPGVNERPLSLLSHTPVRFTVAAVGPFTRALHHLQPGDALWVRGPYGRGFPITGRYMVMVAGGYGVAPLHFLAQEARQTGCHITVIVGARTRRDVLFVERFTALGVPLLITTDDGSYGRRGTVADALADVIRGSHPVDAVYACGPAPMLEAVNRLCKAARVPAYLSWEGIMRCGMGICGTCARGAWLVCRDGPVAYPEDDSSTSINAGGIASASHTSRLPR